jgi:hypothetical protein
MATRTKLTNAAELSNDPGPPQPERARYCPPIIRERVRQTMWEECYILHEPDLFQPIQVMLRVHQQPAHPRKRRPRYSRRHRWMTMTRASLAELREEMRGVACGERDARAPPRRSAPTGLPALPAPVGSAGASQATSAARGTERRGRMTTAALQVGHSPTLGCSSRVNSQPVLRPSNTVSKLGAAPAAETGGIHCGVLS